MARMNKLAAEAEAGRAARKARARGATAPIGRLGAIIRQWRLRRTPR
jgi:hypothetical protein